MNGYRYTDSYRESQDAKRAGYVVTLSAHGWKIEESRRMLEAREARQLAETAREFAHETDGESGLFCHSCSTVWNRLGGIRRLADLDCVACPAIYSSVAQNEEG